MVKYSMLIKSQEVKGLPNIKSAIKRVKVTEAKSIKNVIRKSALKTILKKTKEAVATNDSAAPQLVINATKALDKAAAKNILHKNTAARRKSKLAKAMNANAAK